MGSRSKYKARDGDKETVVKLWQVEALMEQGMRRIDTIGPVGVTKQTD